MKNILLVCGAGMSTSLLVKRMQEEDTNHNYNIRCSDTVSAKVLMLQCDIFLLAPHISYMKDDFLGQCKKYDIPFMVIDSIEYTKMDGKNVLNKVSKILEKDKREKIFKIVLIHANTGAMSDLIVMDMKKKQNEQEKKWIIESCEVGQFEGDENISVILIEPQIYYEETTIKRKIKNPSILISIPPRNLYATFDGRKFLDYIHQINDKNERRV